MYADAATPVNCVFAVTIRGHLSAERLHAALAGIQGKHPLLRVGIREDEKGRPYFVANAQVPAIPVRIVERTSAHDWEKESRTEWAILCDLPNGPLARIVWLRSGTVSDLILVCPHCICDGATCVTLLRELLQLLDQPDKRLEAYDSFHSIEELIPASLLSDKKKRLKGTLFSLLARVILGLKPHKPATGEQPYMIRWKFSEAASAALLARCKAEHTTVHAALCVAFLGAFHQIKGKQARRKVLCPADIRRFVPEIKSDHLFAFAPVIELQVSDEPHNSFWAKGRQLKDELTNKMAGTNVYELLMMGEYFHASAKGIIRHLRSSRGSHDLTLSNMGRLDIPEQYDSFEVETIYSPSVAFPWRNPNTLVVSTYRGQMDFALLSNDSFLPYAEAEAIRDNAIECLLKESVVTATAPAQATALFQ